MRFHSLTTKTQKSERNVGFLLALIFIGCFLYFSGKVYYRMSQYYLHGESTTGTILQVNTSQKYNTENRSWETYIDASAQYKVGSVNCYINLDRRLSSQKSLDEYRKDKKIAIFYLPDQPCNGTRNPNAWAILAHGFTGFSFLILIILIYAIRKETD